MSTGSANKDINLSRHRYGKSFTSGYEDRSGFDSQSLANKAYVDQVGKGLDTKPSCRAGTTGAYQQLIIMVVQVLVQL